MKIFHSKERLDDLTDLVIVIAKDNLNLHLMNTKLRLRLMEIEERIEQLGFNQDQLAQDCDSMDREVRGRLIRLEKETLV